VIFGIIPSGLLFLWISFNGKIPYFPQEPLFTLERNTLQAKITFNILAFVLWGFSHSLFAQSEYHKILTKIFPIQVMRIMFYVSTGFATIILLRVWQPLDIIVWTIPSLSPKENEMLSVVLYWLIFSLNILQVWKLGVLDFFGVRSIRK